MNTLSNEEGDKLEGASLKDLPTEQKVGRSARCEYCDKLLARTSLRQHIRDVHFKILKKCPDCGNSFNVRSLKSHREAVHLKKRKECPDCGKSLGIQAVYSHRKHNCKAKNKTDKKVMCHLCGKEISKKYLQKHIRTVHSAQSEYVQCDLCPKRIVQQNMKRHKAFHRRVFIKALCV